MFGLRLISEQLPCRIAPFSRDAERQRSGARSLEAPQPTRSAALALRVAATRRTLGEKVMLTTLRRTLLAVCWLSLLLLGSAAGQSKQPADPGALLKDVKAPKDYQVTIFASPPEVSYPTCLACSPTGEVFVGVDLNGSLDAKPDRGKILRLVDTKGTGKADKITVFAKVDSPRGL